MWNDEPIERGWQTTRFDYKKISNNQHQPVSDSLRVAFAIDRALGRNCSHQPDHNEYDPADANDPKARRVSVNLHLIAAKEVRSVPLPLRQTPIHAAAIAVSVSGKIWKT